MTHRKIALVGDGSADIRRFHRETLSSIGFLSLETPDGFHLLDRLRKIRPSLVLVDMELPGLDATEVLHFIRRSEDWMDIPVIVTSAQVDPGTKRMVLQAGGTVFLEKPLSAQTLKAAVAELLLPEVPAPQRWEARNRSAFRPPAV
jgi:CheY-like chemotaxis protein